MRPLLAPLSIGFCLAVAAAAAPPAPPGDRALSVLEVVELALARSPDLDAARARIDQARQDLAMARAAFRPGVGLDVQYLHADAASAYLFKAVDARQLPPGANFNQPGVFGNLETALGMRYTLWDAGRRREAREQAERGIEARRHQREVASNDLIWTVIRAYFDRLAAGEAVSVTEDAQETVQSQLEETRVRFTHGGALRSDVLSLEVRESQAREGLIQARNAVELADSALARLLDLPPDRRIELSGEEWHPSEMPKTFADGVMVARTYRPELAAITEQIAAARRGLGLARADKKPRLDLLGRYWMDGIDGDVSIDRDNWTVAAAVSWDVFDGGRRDAAVRKARSGLAELEARERSLLRAVELEVRQAYLELEAARARDEVARANVTRAEEGLRLVKEQYEGGAATVTRYLQAEEDRTRSRFQEIQTRYAIKKARAGVGHALGLCLRNIPARLADREEP